MKIVNYTPPKVSIKRYVNRNKHYMVQNWKDGWIRVKYKSKESYIKAKIQRLKNSVMNGYLSTDEMSLQSACNELECFLIKNI